MKILVAGGSGFIGRNLVKKLLSNGHEVKVFSHQKTILDNLNLDKSIEVINFESKEFPKVDVIVNLAGVAIDKKRWTKSFLKQIYTSRFDTAKFLIEKYKDLSDITFIQASATSLYENTLDVIDENSKLKNFENNFSSISNVNLKLEKDIKDLCDKYSFKCAFTRIGIVIGIEGGFLRLLTKHPILKFIKPIFIDGNNYISYIGIDDCSNALLFVIENKILGAINLCSPNTITLKQLFLKYSKGKLPILAFKLSLLLDKRGALLYSSQNIKPKKLLDNGFTFTDN